MLIVGILIYIVGVAMLLLSLFGFKFTNLDSTGFSQLIYLTIPLQLICSLIGLGIGPFLIYGGIKKYSFSRILKMDSKELINFKLFRYTYIFGVLLWLIIELFKFAHLFK